MMHYYAHKVTKLTAVTVKTLNVKQKCIFILRIALIQLPLYHVFAYKYMFFSMYQLLCFVLHYVCFSYAFFKFSVTGRQTYSTLSIYRHLTEVSERLRSIKKTTWIT